MFFSADKCSRFLQIFRKSALKIVQDGVDVVHVTPDNLFEYVGNPVFNSDRIYKDTPAGVVMGLAWTAMGEWLKF